MQYKANTKYILEEWKKRIKLKENKVFTKMAKECSLLQNVYTSQYLDGCIPYIIIALIGLFELIFHIYKIK